MIRRAWSWAFGPGGDGFVLFLAATLVHVIAFLAIALGCVVVVALATWAFG